MYSFIAPKSGVERRYTAYPSLSSDATVVPVSHAPYLTILDRDSFTPNVTDIWAPTAAALDQARADLASGALSGPQRLTMPQRDLRLRNFIPIQGALALASARKALERWTDGTAADITHVLTTTASGWEEPGIACHLIHSLGLSLQTQKAELTYNGCFCPMTCLRLARDIIRSSEPGERRAVLVVGTEDSWSHGNLDLHLLTEIVCESLFGSGSGAFIVATDGEWELDAAGMSLIPGSETMLSMSPHGAGHLATADTPPEMSQFMYLHKDVGLRIGEFLFQEYGATILARILTPGTELACHPGGPKILEALHTVFTASGRSQADADTLLTYSRETLAQFGNLGATALLFVLARALADSKADAMATMAFGPGVTCEWGHLTRHRRA